MVEIMTMVGSAAGHRIPLGSTSWSVWRQAFFRTTGFPADGLDLLAAPSCAKMADAYLAGLADSGEFSAEFQKAIAESSRQVYHLAAEPLLREAITWQNPGVIGLLDALRRSGPDGSRNTRRRYREQQLSRFWQRYCAKTETIGFFGPGLWISVDPDSAAVTAVPGPGLIERRQVFLEPWALATYGAGLAEDEQIRRWLPPAPIPHYAPGPGCLLRPGADPAALCPEEEAALRRCDGRRPAAQIVAELLAEPSGSLRTEDSGYRLLHSLVQRRLLTWDANLSVGPQTAATLDERIAAIGDIPARRRARAGLDRLAAATAAVTAAAGDAEALAGALAALDAEFTATTAHGARRREGKTYAGRGVCYEDTTRDLRLAIGRDVLADIAPALSIVAQVARWVTHEVGRAYEDALQKIFVDMPQESQEITLADLWYPAMKLFHGAGRKPVDEVMEALAAGWRQLFGDVGAAGDAAGARSLSLTSAQIAARVGEVFSADRPGWSLARIHSPDLHLSASSLSALNAGDFLAVLGEIHIAYATLAGTCATWSQDNPGRVLDLAISDFGRTRILPLFPAAWTRDPGRNVSIENSPDDWRIGFARAKGVDAAKLIPVGTVPVFLADGRLSGTTPDGQVVPVLEFFAFFLSRIVVNAFRDVAPHRHTPRISVDRLVMFRETWRMQVDDLSELTDTALRDEAGQYLAGRRLVAALGLPERCFVKVSTETKPFYVDFTSPLYVGSFCSMLRAAKAAAGDDATVRISEMLPTPDQAWVPDGQDRRYFGELRLHLTDPASAATTAEPAASTQRARHGR